MTQDHYGQGQSAGSAVRGEVVPDEDADETQGEGEQTAPATLFQKVAPSPDGDAGQTSQPAAGTAATQDDPDQAGITTDPQEATEPLTIAPAGVTGKQPSVPAEPELRPGDTEAAPSGFDDLAYGSLLPDASEFKQRWHQVQFRFVDDPPGSVTEAADVIAQVTAKLEAAIAERQRSLRARWSEGTSGDTETLRATLLMYRAFLDQLTGAR